MRRHIFSIAFIFFLIGCAANDGMTMQDRNVIAAGVLDVNVIDGSFIPDTCENIIFGDARDTILGCVAYDLSSEGVDGKDWDSEYLQALVDKGWSIVGGVANVYNLERDGLAPNCTQNLGMIFLPFGDEAEVAKYGTEKEGDIEWDKIPFGIIYFAGDSAPVCDRDAS